VHPVGLDERHRRRDASQQLVVRRFGRLGSHGDRGALHRHFRSRLCHRLRFDDESGSVPVGRLWRRYGSFGSRLRCRHDGVVSALEQLPPGRVNRLRVVAVLLEQLLDVSGVEPR
jgi:hypothetical protein